MALFKNVPYDHLSWTQGHRHTQFSLKAKDYLYVEGDNPNYVFTLFSGWIKLYKSLGCGKKQVLRFALPGDFLGFQGSLDGLMLHSAQALDHCVVCAFPRDQIQELFCKEPAIGNEMIMMNAQVMSVCQEYLLSTGVRNAQERIAFLMLELFSRLRLLGRFREENISENSAIVPITQEDIADAVGMTQIHVNRMLQQMKEERLLSCANGRLEILDNDALVKLANFDPKLLEIRPMYGVR
ncbi:MAG: hypothetical protein DSZ28_04770 [Thiothrix sp.]|nr:MAG: hypothetical protein DSZ28_04770 [Thiothrix sp.]